MNIDMFPVNFRDDNYEGMLLQNWWGDTDSVLVIFLKKEVSYTL